MLKNIQVTEDLLDYIYDHSNPLHQIQKDILNHNKNLGQIIKYEDMVNKPEATFRNILETICAKMKLTFDEKKYQNSLESLNFTKLQKMENEITFHESVHKNQKFFRK